MAFHQLRFGIVIVKQSKRVLLPCFAHHLDVLQVILYLWIPILMVFPVLLEIGAEFWEVLLNCSYLVLTVHISSIVTVAIRLVSAAYHSSRTLMLVSVSLLIAIYLCNTRTWSRVLSSFALVSIAWVHSP